MEWETYRPFAVACTVVVFLYVACTLYIGLREYATERRKLKEAKKARALLRVAHLARQAGAVGLPVEPECAGPVPLRSPTIREAA